MTYIFLSNTDVQNKPPVKWLVHKVIKAGGLSCIYGMSGSGKTFLTLDMLLSVASGRNWFEMKTMQVPVTYLCLESRNAIAMRIRAWEMNNQSCPDNFKQIHDDFDFKFKKDVIELAELINNSNMNQGLIAIDTFNASIHGLDENSSRDMGVVLQHLKLLSKLTDCAIAIVHHSGKDSSQGMRGHSSLHAALDNIIEVKSAAYSSWRVVKNKDAEDNLSFNFKLTPIEIGEDSEGDSISSCFVEASSIPASTSKMPSGKNQVLVHDKLMSTLKAMPANEHILLTDAIDLGATVLDHVESCKQKNTSRQVIKKLAQDGHLQILEHQGIQVLML